MPAIFLEPCPDKHQPGSSGTLYPLSCSARLLSIQQQPKVLASATTSPTGPVTKMALDLEEIDRSMSFLPSEACVVSCGTVTMDPVASKVLLIWNRHLEIYQLPKGRKDIGEEMLSAALRETREETGVEASPLNLKIATRATPPSSTTVADVEIKAGAGGFAPPTKEVTDDLLSSEFIGCCRYPDPQSSTPAEKVVYYYAAIADSTLPRGPGTARDMAKLKEVWASSSEAPGMLRFRAEADIVRKALEDARRSGYPMPG